jgi:deubiquitinase DESI2
LTKNCNHFTAFLCRKLTGRPGPAWLNRAASIGLALPCVVPRDWVDPPEFESADGELLHHRGSNSGSGASNDPYEDYFSDYGDDDDDAHGERTSMLRQSSQHQVHLVGLDSPSASARSSMAGTRGSGEYQPEHFEEGDADVQTGRRSSNKGKGRSGIARDSSGNALPPSERVPTM